MAWTNFAALGVGPGTTPQLDADLLILSEMANIPCSVSGTNTLVLTPTNPAGTLPGYLNYMNLICIAAATNTAAVTANFSTFGGLNIYKDTPNGPTLLTGGEIVQFCEFRLIYDLALNGGLGGFHLVGGGNPAAGATITAASINATLGSIASLSVNNLQGGTIGIINYPFGSIASLSVSNLQMGTAGVLNLMQRLQSTLVSFSIVAGNALVPGAEAVSTISFSGCQVSDNVIVSPETPSASLNYSGYVGAAGSIIFKVRNEAVSATVTVSLFTIRFTDIGWAS